MSMRITLVFMVLLAAPLFAQSAKVIELSGADARDAKSLHAMRDDIDKQIKQLDAKIKREYLTASRDEEGHANTYASGHDWVWVKSGWGTGQFEYSEDFRFIVPVAAPTISGSGSTWNGFGALTCCPVSVPVTGSIGSNGLLLNAIQGASN